jgi:hypothetical protein
MGCEEDLPRYEYAAPAVPTDAQGLLRAAVDLLAALDPSDLPTAELAELALDLQRQRHRLAGIAAQVLGRWQSSGIWAFDGSRTAAAHLARETRSSTAACRQELRRATAAAAMPAVAKAVIDGGLAIEHLDLFAATRTPSRTEAMEKDLVSLVESCRSLNFADARRTLAYWATKVDASAGGSHDEASSDDDQARVYLSETYGGTYVLNGTLDPLSGGILAAELARLEQLIAAKDLADGKVRTPAQRRAEALREMAQRSAHLPPDGRTARPLFTVLLGEDSLRHLCELAEGTVLRPGQLLPWLTTADLETVLFDGPHTVVSVSRRRRFTGAVRRAIEVRDRRCTHPSDCDVPAHRCDVDHIIPHSEHGPTSQFNGRLQCPTHNRNAARHASSSREPIAPHRALTELDHIRCRLRFRYLRESQDGDPDHSG